MAKLDYNLLAKEYIELLGGSANIITAVNCMTRLRITLKDQNLAKLDGIRACVDSLGVVVQAEQIQIILGPGKVTKVCVEFNLLLDEYRASHIDEDISVVNNGSINDTDLAKIEREKVVAKRATSFFGSFIKKFSSIFLPLIPGLIACGIVLGLSNVLNNTIPGFKESNVGMQISTLGSIIYYGLSIFIGINAAKEFGGTPIFGGLMASIIVTPALSDLTVYGMTMTPARGGIIAVIILVIFTSVLEKRLRKIIPDSLELFTVGPIVLLVGGFMSMYLIQPLGGYISDGVTYLFIDILLKQGGVVSGYIMAGTFLPIVLTGLHQGLTPIYLELLHKYGVNTFWPILAMAGSGPIGASVYVYMKTKNKKLKNIIKASLPIGVLGVGEPLLYS